MIEIFTDGACCPNPGPGAWAAIVRRPDKPLLELVGFHPDTTNNRMEMMGAIAALEELAEGQRLRAVVTTDSQYLVRGITSWVHTWRRNGWRTRGKKPVINQDLWVRLHQLTLLHQVRFEWVRGHNGHPENERCDRLASRHLARMSGSAMVSRKTREAAPRRNAAGGGQPTSERDLFGKTRDASHR